MPINVGSQFTRHEVLVRAWRALAALALLAITGHPRQAATAKAQKEDVAYQDRPKAGKSCASCRQFSPTAAGKGICALVEGEISANGWCVAYSPSGSATSQGSPAKTAVTQLRANHVRNAAVANTAHTEEGAHT